MQYNPTESPRVVGVRRTETQVQVSIVVPFELTCFAGHFPGNPIVPGFLQVGWAVEAARQNFIPDGILAQIEGLKFLSLLTPGTDAEIVLTQKCPGTIQFKIQSPSTLFASGQLRFQQVAPGTAG